jgi:hypothetical protein
VDGHRRYADEPEQPTWYTGQSPATGQSQYGGASPYDPGIHERPSGAFRLQEQGPADSTYEPYPAPDPVTSTGSHARPTTEPARMPVRGPEYPAIRPTNAASLADAPGYGGDAAAPSSGLPAPAAPAYDEPTYDEPTGLVPPVAGAERGRPGADSVYSTRRPVSAVVVAAGTLLLMVPVVRLLIQATFADDPAARSIVPAVLLTLGLPLTGVGLYALAGGGRPHNRDTWLRPPVAYLPAGLFLVLAAALAVA